MIETIVTIRSPMVRMISVSLIGSFRSNSCAVASSVGYLYYLQEKVVLVQFSVEYGNVSPVDTYSPWDHFMDLNDLLKVRIHQKSCDLARFAGLWGQD